MKDLFSRERRTYFGKRGIMRWKINLDGLLRLYRLLRIYNNPSYSWYTYPDSLFFPQTVDNKPMDKFKIKTYCWFMEILRFKKRLTSASIKKAMGFLKIYKNVSSFWILSTILIFWIAPEPYTFLKARSILIQFEIS